MEAIPAHVSRLTSYIKAEGSASPFKKADNRVGPLLNCKSRQLIPARVSRLPSYIKAEVALHLEASPGSDHFCSTFFSSSPISHGEDGLSTICLLFIVYLPDIYEFTFLPFLLLKHASLHRPFRMGGTVYQLSACCLLFILSAWYLRVHILHFLLFKHASLEGLFRTGESDYL